MQLIIFDFNRTLYDPESDALNPGALDVLQHFTGKDIPLVLISRREGGRKDLFSKLGIEKYFREVIFVDEKDVDLFKRVIKKHGSTPKTTLVVGDHPHSEIRHGNAAGARTIRLKSGKFADLEEEMGDGPWRTIRHLRELMDWS